MANKVLFLTGLFPAEIRDEIISNSKFNTQFAADALQWSFIKGLNFYYKDLRVLNFPFIGSYPTLNKTTSVKQFSFGKEWGFDGLNVSYFNFLALKNIDIYNRARKYIQIWAHQNKGEKTVLIYSAFLPFLKAALSVKNKMADLKVVLVLPDIPEFMGGPDNVLYRAFKTYTKNALQRNFEQVDGYVLLTEYMTERLPTKDKKWTVVEGIFNDEGVERPIKNQGDKKIILYTGTLAARYGILNLLKAFQMIREENYLLVICGDGDTKEDINLAAEKDKRIIYKGSIDRSEVLQLQKQASLLVNPRTSEGDFTRFSFPSKTMEYLASGVPTLLYKLPGIPQEYYKYCYTLEDVSPNALSDKITEILRLDTIELLEKGKKAREFILAEKNPQVQCKKIYQLIEKQL